MISLALRGPDDCPAPIKRFDASTSTSSAAAAALDADLVVLLLVATAVDVGATSPDVLPLAAADPYGKGSAAAVLASPLEPDVADALASDVGWLRATGEVVEPDVAMPAVSQASGSMAGSVRPVTVAAKSTPAASTAGTSKPLVPMSWLRPLQQAERAPRVIDDEIDPRTLARIAPAYLTARPILRMSEQRSH